MAGYLGLEGEWSMTAISIRFLYEMMKMFLHCGSLHNSMNIRKITKNVCLKWVNYIAC